MRTKTGFLVTPGDSSALATPIRMLSREPDGALCMGQQGRAVLEKQLTVEALIDQYEGLYERLATRRGARDAN
jgi:hypothetical protein